MDYLILSKIAVELAEVITGCRVERVAEDGRGSLYIILTRGKKKLPLFLSPDRVTPCLYLLSTRPAPFVSPSLFVQYLRSRLAGSIVTGIGLLNEDRIVEIYFKKADREYRLIFELFGHSTNLLLIDSVSSILAIYRPVPAGEGITRPLVTGMPYTLPRSRPDRIGRFPREDLPEESKNGLSDGDLPVNHAVEEWYGRLDREREQADIRRELSVKLKRTIARAERKVQAMELDYRSAGRAEEFRCSGELILRNMKSITRGTETIELEDFDGRKLVVTLDPKLSTAMNAERYFRKYKKAKAGISRIQVLLAAAQEHLSVLRCLVPELDAAKDIDALSVIREKMSRMGLAAARNAGGGKEKTLPILPYRVFDESGWEILVGRNAAGNDELTTKLARPDDLWLHAEGIPGSHVLVRSRKGADIPQDVLLKAASLAAHFSRGKSGVKVPVTYTRAKFVKKPRGAKPGAVILSRRRTILVKPANDV